MIKSVDSEPPYASQANRISELEKKNDELEEKLFYALQAIPKGVNLDDFIEDDSTFNFRVNAALKQKFSDVCKRQHLTVGIALKRYMTDCVVAGVLK